MFVVDCGFSKPPVEGRVRCGWPNSTGARRGLITYLEAYLIAHGARGAAVCMVCVTGHSVSACARGCAVPGKCRAGLWVYLHPRLPNIPTFLVPRRVPNEAVVDTVERGNGTIIAIFFAADMIVLVKYSLRLRKAVVLLRPGVKTKWRCRGQWSTTWDALQ